MNSSAKLKCFYDPGFTYVSSANSRELKLFDSIFNQTLPDVPSSIISDSDFL